MAKFKFSPSLFLEVAELERFRKFLDDDGFRKNIIENSVSFGLIKNNRDITFPNGRVEQDFDNTLGEKTIKIKEIHAIDKDGYFIYNPVVRGLTIPSDGNWYWARISYLTTNIEKGIYSIGVNGALTCTDGVGELTKILRGEPNFASRIKFVNSVNNTLEYDVLEVINDNTAILQHPAVNSGGASAFNAESNLQLKVVGTFDTDITTPEDYKYPFNYDSCKLEIVAETSLNTKPTFVSGLEFYLARFRVQTGILEIQDKRIECWETKGSELAVSIERADNPLIGVEAVNWNYKDFSPSEMNVVSLGWGMRTVNWTVDSSKNIVTFLDGTGGKFKTVNNFTNGQFNGWRLYTGNGRYSRILSSIKQGAAINCTVDVLDIDDYSNDGGITFLTQWILAVPNVEEVEFKFNPNPAEGLYVGEAFRKEFSYPVNTLIGKPELLVFKDPSCLYEVYYRYKSFKEYTEWTLLPSDTDNGYFTEDSHDSEGLILPIADRTLYPYTAVANAGFIRLVLAPWSYKTTIGTIYKGDKIDVQTITDLSSSTVIELKVGVTARYLYITGTVSLTGNVTFALSNEKAVKGNEFRIHFDCDSLDLTGNNIYITQDITLATPVIIKTIETADVYAMYNQDGGICFDCVYDGTKWIMYQNYDSGQPFEVKMAVGVIGDLFDSGTKLGKVKGWFGYRLMDGTGGTLSMNGRSPMGVGVYTEGPDTYTYNVGDTAGEAKHQLSAGEMPTHSHPINDPGHVHSAKHGSGSPRGTGGPAFVRFDIPTPDIDGLRAPSPGSPGRIIASAQTGITLNNAGGNQKHENRHPVAVVIFAQRLF